MPRPAETITITAEIRQSTEQSQLITHKEEILIDETPPPYMGLG